MKARWRAAAIATGLSLALARGAVAQQVAEQGMLCRAAIRQAEAGSGLPPLLLNGIARVESGRPDPATGRFSPWPWTINAEGRGMFFDTKADAVAEARRLRARGVQSFDVGCLQVNLMHHPDAFATLEEAFDPGANARYAVRFLTTLRDKTGTWDEASAWYHSANPEFGRPYRALVASAMAEEARAPSPPASFAPPGGFSVVPPALSSLPSRPGVTILLAQSSVGAGAGAGAGVGAVVGRGLDAYRARPVAIVGGRMLAAR